MTNTAPKHATPEDVQRRLVTASGVAVDVAARLLDATTRVTGTALSSWDMRPLAAAALMFAAAACFDAAMRDRT